MKHKYTDEQIQAAIDEACQETAEAHPYTSQLLTLENYRGSDYDREASARRDLLKSALDRLPEPPPPTADGKTPGHLLYEVMNPDNCAIPYDVKLVGKCWEECASAVLAAFGGAGLEAAIARMEAVPHQTLRERHVCSRTISEGVEDVRRSLIAAASEGLSPAAVDWKAKYEECEKNLRAKFEPEVAEWKASAERWKAAAQSIREQINAQQARAEKAEAELARKNEMWENQMIVIRRLQLQVEELEDKSYLSTLRPISEAGEVPAGCVRVFGELHDDGDWIVGTLFVNGDTHFADILPPEAKAPAVEAAKPAYIGYMTDEMPDKPTPPTFTAHGKTWNVHVSGDPMPCDGDCWVHWLTHEEGGKYHEARAQASKLLWTYVCAWRYADEPTPVEPVKPWTPAVGDVVMLKSGGPKMTVVNTAPELHFWCNWFDGAERHEGCFPTATLQPA